MFALCLFADADASLTGSGWTGSGLLGAVLAWLLFRHLPLKDEQVKQLIDRHDVHTRDIMDRNTAVLREARAEFSSGAGVLLYKGAVTPNISVSSGVTPQLTTATAVTED